MGRMKTLLCAYCYEKELEPPEEGGIDVSHLAIPRLKPNELNSSDNDSNNNNNNHITINSNTNEDTNSNLINTSNNINAHEYPHAPTPSTPQNRPQPAPPSARVPPIPIEQESRPQNQEARRESPRLEQAAGDALAQASPESGTKLSYDIISVREPLAKMLADRQRQLTIGEHDYNEVYGERDSSCFYEEIGGSTASSVTYDQIGAPPGYNYQASIDTYAQVNRPNLRLQDNDGYERVQPSSLIQTCAVVNKPNRRTQENERPQDNDGYERVPEPRTSNDLYSKVTRPNRIVPDNDDYESVSPQSSPSNAIVEPNYEAIGLPSEF